jgi:hypothetical protein
MADEVIVVEPIIPIITVINETPTITVSSPGPQGQPGTFASSDIFYTHIQAVAAAVWTINHNLNGYPTAVVLDSAGTNCEGTFSYPSVNQMVITFSSAFAGTAYII